MKMLQPWPAGRLFTGVTDPRVARTRRHLLCDILLITLSATLAGAEGFCDMAEWAQTKEGWLRTFLELPGGIPSHDTFERVFRRLDPEQLHACFLRWINSCVGGPSPRQIAIDGKTLRRSFEGTDGKPALHVVSAFASEGLDLVLGQVAVREKSNEITAIPELLRLLDLRGACVTIDAMGTHKDIAAQITAQEGDYVLALKANHSLLHEDARRLFADEAALAGLGKAVSREQTIEKDHGRIEERSCVALPVEAWFGGLRGMAGRALALCGRKPLLAGAWWIRERGATLLPEQLARAC